MALQRWDQRSDNRQVLQRKRTRVVLRRSHLARRARLLAQLFDLLLHGSEPNLSKTDRRGLTLRYMPSDVQCIDSNFAKNRRAFQCLGKNPEKHWSVLSPPIGEAIPLKLESPL